MKGGSKGSHVEGTYTLWTKVSHTQTHRGLNCLREPRETETPLGPNQDCTVLILSYGSQRLHFIIQAGGIAHKWSSNIAHACLRIPHLPFHCGGSHVCTNGI